MHPPKIVKTPKADSHSQYDYWDPFSNNPCLKHKLSDFLCMGNFPVLGLQFRDLLVTQEFISHIMIAATMYPRIALQGQTISFFIPELFNEFKDSRLNSS